LPLSTPLPRKAALIWQRRRPSPTRTAANVVAYLGLPHPEREFLKARLTLQIYRDIKARDLTQVQAGEFLGIKQCHVSLLMRNRSHIPPVEAFRPHCVTVNVPSWNGYLSSSSVFVKRAAD